MGETGLTDVFNPGGRFGPFPEGSRGKSGMEKKARDKGDGEGDFLGGTRSALPQGTAGRMARHCVATGAFTMSRWPKGQMPRSSASVPRGRAEPAPPRGGPARVRWPRGENPGIMRGEVFRRGAVSASGWQGRRRAGVWRDYRRVGDRRVAE